MLDIRIPNLEHQSSNLDNRTSNIETMNYLYLIALTTGLVSSLHCVGMCGPLALALPVGRLSRFNAFFAKILYNLGRISTYSMLGLIFGFIGENIFLFNLQQKLSIILGVVLLIIIFFQNDWLITIIPSPLRRGIKGEVNFRFISFLKSKIAKFINPKSLLGFYTLGLLNGLLPCAMIYVALTGATVSASLTEGMIYMAFFGLGTAPAMFAISQFSSIIKKAKYIRKITPIYSIVVSIFLIIRGLNLGIPYLSPQVSESKAAITVCHGK